MTGGRSDQFSMEMAAAMLFVEHGLDQVRQLPEDFGQHAEAVGQRLLALAQGETPPEAPVWQGELARELQQGQTVAVLAGEIRTGLRQVEKLIDEYYENPARVAALEQADPLLHQLQARSSILDQDQATRAVAPRARTRARAGRRRAGRRHPRAGAGKPGPERRRARLLHRRAGAEHRERAPALPLRRRRAAVPRAALRCGRREQGAPAPSTPPRAGRAPAPRRAGAGACPPARVQADAAIEAELLEIFIGEAQEVLAVVAETLPAAHANPDSQETLTRLRRSFHTLKGSGRMVGLEQFAPAAAAIEKVMNLWLAESRAATPDLLALLDHAHAELSAWVDELAAGGAGAQRRSAGRGRRAGAGGRGLRDGDAAAAEPPRSRAATGAEPEPPSRAAAERGRLPAGRREHQAHRRARDPAAAV